MRIIIDKFNCKGLEEDVFDWVFAYFPITFQSNDDDPFGITQDDLKSALLNCMSSNLIGMGEFVIPFLMEKMESSLGLTKRDTMLFLAQASKVYNHKLFYAIALKLWVWLKEEVSQFRV